jgi:hypothetical protein
MRCVVNGCMAKRKYCRDLECFFVLYINHMVCVFELLLLYLQSHVMIPLSGLSCTLPQIWSLSGLVLSWRCSLHLGDAHCMEA